ncbi:rhodanese-like domain-containing protein [Geomesophilobacter sediminis]|uniref:Rhodanese-like domain-containing protein n=1 Tax=Geomesophilobacter sediminis TaxID=2798584 RepID=A0A8J7JA77_9BACT|nr:rhodanese-like domain-containing protein [Geomesophilobacter sediminis]MBJ6723726.1 rhodanese-like domain-containing protein [Geomesophilobacter sediminis]
MLRRSLVVVSLLLLIPMSTFAAGVKNLTSPQVKTFLAQKKDAFLLDVRTPDEYRQAHLHGAVLIPLSELGARLNSVPKNRPVVVYCAVGARSASAAAMLVEKGFRDVYHMTDGIVGWYRNGFPIER